MLADFQNLSLASLVDLLARYTERHTQLLADKSFDDEFRKSKEIIQQLQVVIEIRRREMSDNIPQIP